MKIGYKIVLLGVCLIVTFHDNSGVKRSFQNNTGHSLDICLECNKIVIYFLRPEIFKRLGTFQMSWLWKHLRHFSHKIIFNCEKIRLGQNYIRLIGRTGHSLCFKGRIPERNDHINIEWKLSKYSGTDCLISSNKPRQWHFNW